MDTSAVIIAVASPPGRSHRGIVRISGAQAFELCEGLLHFMDAAPDQAHGARDSAAIDTGERSGDDIRASDWMNHASRAGPTAVGGPANLRGLHRARGACRVQFKLSANRHFSIFAFLFPTPHSYTGEHSIELQMPGNPALIDQTIVAILAHALRRNIDARRAEPGEFTARAFFNGKLSLTQAEGVAATIAALSEAELRAAQLLTSGSLGEIAHRLADDLAAALALVEAGIDFTDQEDVVAIAPADLLQRLRGLQGHISSQLQHAVGTEQLRAIPWVVLRGRPNAGKSALFNALLGHERAVVSPTAGTTRDVLAEPLTISTPHGPGAAEVMLVDLAGIDVDDETSINRLMQIAAADAVDRAELVLRCVPVDEEVDSDAARNDNEILVRTKADLDQGRGGVQTQKRDDTEAQQREEPNPRPELGPSPSHRLTVSPPHPLTPSPSHPLAASPTHRLTVSPTQIFVSAFTCENLDHLRHAIAQRLADRAVSLAADALALRPRHEAALRSALANLRESIDLVEPLASNRSLRDAELIASSMRAALNDLADLAGDITPDDVLGRVFATFCVGK